LINEDSGSDAYQVLITDFQGRNLYQRNGILQSVNQELAAWGRERAAPGVYWLNVIDARLVYHKALKEVKQ
jgi:hypothetical protein